MISLDVQKLDPGAMVELFVLDLTPCGGPVKYFHAGTNELRSSVVWQGNTFEPWAIQAKGFDRSTTGQLPRPTLSASNVAGVIGALARDYGDLLGAVVTRKRTFVRYLDAVNFAAGNPTADPTPEFVDAFYVEQKSAENKNIIEFTLAAQMDLPNVMLPLRVVTTMCGWKYRGAQCTYSGGPVADANDVATSDPSKDSCGKRLSSCKLRFSGVLPFGGFPAADLQR